MLKLGIPKGSLQDATIALFEKSGWKIRMHHRNYFPEINDPELTCSMFRVVLDMAPDALSKLRGTPTVERVPEGVALRIPK